ncbi:MAG: T9SS type A sorting domain-containing protein [Flavobacteriales bacterium]
MIKKLLVLAAFIITLGNSVEAQCLPDQNLTNPGFYPSSLPDAVAGQSYSQILQFKLATDTTYMNMSGTIQSVTLSEVKNLPSGFTWSCNKAPGACTYNGGDVGCISISGNPNAGMVGNYNVTLKMSFTVSVNPNPSPLTLTWDVPVALKVVASNGLTATKAPFFAIQQREEDWVLLNQASGKLSVTVFDMLGRVVKTGTYQSIKGEATYINVATLERGIYFVNLQLNGRQETVKISKGY